MAPRASARSDAVERKLWNVLRGSSTVYKFRRQHSLGPYIADFYSRDAHLVVEIDGPWHGRIRLSQRFAPFTTVAAAPRPTLPNN